MVGSINMDLVLQVPRLPEPGETLAASAFHALPGGKGANQAVAVARLGAQALLIGRLGRDGFGDRLLAGLRDDGVETRTVQALPGTHSGVAVIGVDPAGQNSILLASGANALLRPSDLRAQESLIAKADAVLLQLEIPVATAATAIRLARRHRVPVVLDSAPVPPDGLPPGAFRGVDILSPNQTEATLLTGLACDTLDEACAAADLLVRRYDPGVVVIKLGPLGALAYAGTSEFLHVPAFPARAVDTTAAGDAFSAALTVRLAEGASLGDALRFANAAGALAITRQGAQPAMPKRRDVERLLRQHPLPPSSS